MLSRHFLRSKVLQILYSRRLVTCSNIEAAHNFDYHISRLNELGILQVSLLPKMLEAANKVLEQGTKKFFPTDEELNPNRRLLNNEFLRRMADNFELRQLMDKWAGVWQINDDLVREAFLDFRQHEIYNDYLNAKETGYKEDKEFALMLFRYMMNREALISVIVNRSLLWEDDFEQIAQYNFMMLKSLDEETFNEAMPWPVMYDKRQEKDEVDINFARQLLHATIACQDEAEELIKEHLQGWEFERVALMDIMLINMAVAELTTFESIPEKVTVDEYIELSKEFSSDRSKLFINGILDKLVLELRSKGKIVKSGRGIQNEEL